jgi:late competence protein required for DNA uptake (superfamily II DNA/RNA helicase)
MKELPPASPVEEKEEDNRLKCAICMDTMQEETSTICGHLFCQSCIQGAIKTQKKCPTCRKKLTMKNIHRIYI